MTDDITMVEQQLRQMFGAPLTTSEREPWMIGYGNGWPRRSDRPDRYGVVLVA